MDQEAKSQPRSWQSPRALHASIVAPFTWIVVATVSLSATNFVIAAQFVAYFPLAANDITSPVPDELLRLPVPADCLPNDLAQNWTSYTASWAAHYANPADELARRRLGLPTVAASQKPNVLVTKATRIAGTMRLPIADMQAYESDHFMLLSDVSADRAGEVVLMLENFYHVWTQFFFPLWKDREQWDHSGSSTTRRSLVKHRVVLFSDPARYQQVLSAEGPAALQSTGFYSDQRRVAFFHHGNSNDEATRMHELTHQLMSEATDARPRFRPGDRRDFWLVEGIACFMESTMMLDQYATIGGWQASRLSFARSRVLSFGDDFPLVQMQGEGRAAVQQREDLSRWYSFAAAYTHRSIDEGNGAGLFSLLHRLGTIYQARVLPLARCDRDFDSGAIDGYLNLTDRDISPITHDKLVDLCMSRSQVTRQGIEKIAPQASLRWLELAFIPVTNDDVMRLCPNASTVEQLSLEATAIDDSIGGWLASASKLRELDLSNTRVSDKAIMMLPVSAPIETLWLTGSQVSDASIDKMIAMDKLQRVDLQRTGVSEVGISKLQSSRPGLIVNPLKIESP